jgi:hypothetical protein
LGVTRHQTLGKEPLDRSRSAAWRLRRRA